MWFVPLHSIIRERTMRLGQLARKLEVKSADIVSYLANEHKAEISAHPNSKVDDKLVSAVSKHFLVDKGDSIANQVGAANKDTAETPIKTEKIKDLKVPKKVKEVNKVVSPKNKIDENGEEIINPAPEFEEAIDYDNAEHIETIKPEELAGLKVVDKIDLPPPPPPKMIEVDGVMMEESEFKKKKAEEHKQRKMARKASIEAGYAKRSKKDKDEVRNLEFNAKNKFATEKDKKKEDQEFDKRLKKKQEQIAKKRKEHYAKNNAKKDSIPKKKKKEKIQNYDPLFSDELIDEQVEVTTPKIEEPQISGLAKLWKWFNT